MEEFKKNLAGLLKVKTLVTIAVILVFVILALRGDISADNVMIVISMVVSFYFGTQHEKSTGTAAVNTGYGQTEGVQENAAVPQLESTQPEVTMSELKPPDSDQVQMNKTGFGV